MRSALISIRLIEPESLGVISSEPGTTSLEIRTRLVEGRGIKPAELIAALDLDPLQVSVTRLITDLATLDASKETAPDASQPSRT